MRTLAVDSRRPIRPGTRHWIGGGGGGGSGGGGGGGSGGGGGGGGGGSGGGGGGLLLASATRRSCEPLKTSWSPGKSIGWLLHCQKVYVLQPAGSGPTLIFQEAIHSGLLGPRPA